MKVGAGLRAVSKVSGTSSRSDFDRAPYSYSSVAPDQFKLGYQYRVTGAGIRHAELRTVLYHSPLTTLTLIRIARPHVRTLWAALTLLRSVDGTPVLPRVVAVSGTIKKLQNRAIAYHRLVTATMLEAATRNMPLGEC